MIRLIIRLIWVPVFLVGLGAWTRGHVGAWALFNVAFWVVAQTVSLVLHEAGHALAGRAVGQRAMRIELGMGRRVATWRLGGTRINVNSLPFVGLTLLGGTSARFLRLRQWLAVAAGPAVTGLLFWLSRAALPGVPLAEIMGPATGMVDGPAPFLVLGCVNGWMLVVNLLPFRLSHLSTGTDGFKLLTLPFQSRERVAELMVVPFVYEATEALRERDVARAVPLLESARALHPRSWLLRTTDAFLLMQQERHAEAREAYRVFLDEPGFPAEAKWLVQNNIAWLDYRLGTDDLRAEADAMSAQAMAGSNRSAGAMGTRGAVLVWLGHVEEGMALIERAYMLNSEPTSRAFNAAGLALGHAALGRWVEAAGWLAQARKLDPGCPLIPTADALVTRRAPAPPRAPAVLAPAPPRPGRGRSWVVGFVIILIGVAVGLTAPRGASPAGQPLGGSFENGVSYADVYVRDERAPDMWELPFPSGRDEGWVLPDTPPTSWARRHLCEADARFLRQAAAVTGNDLEAIDRLYGELAAECGGSTLCQQARSAVNSGVELTDFQLVVYARTLEGCAFDALARIHDDPRLPLEARAAWVERYGSTERVDRALLAAAEAWVIDGGSSEMLDAMQIGRALARAPRDGEARERIAALNARFDAGTEQRLAAAGLLMQLVPPEERTRVMREAIGIAKPLDDSPDAGLEERLESGSLPAWEVRSEDGGLAPEARTALIQCARSEGKRAESCLWALSAVDWGLAHQVQETLQPRHRSARSVLLARYATRDDFWGQLNRCGVDAGFPVPDVNMALAEGRLTVRPWLGDPAAQLAELEGCVTREIPARDASQSTRIVAWLDGRRYELALPQGCGVSTRGATVSLLNVLLRARRAERRLYVVEPLGGVPTTLAATPAPVDCLTDAGLLQPVRPDALDRRPEASPGSE